MTKQFDVIIIGGGATGAGVARDCSLRGLKSLLLERGDIATGATGRNHGLLHSGARYAVTDRESAEECIKENMILRRIAAHCVDETGGLFISLPEDGLDFQKKFIESCLAAGISAEAIDPKEALLLEPSVNPMLIGAVKVPDGSVDPFRLTAANIMDARLHGAQVLTYTRVDELIIESGKVVGEIEVAASAGSIAVSVETAGRWIVYEADHASWISFDVKGGVGTGMSDVQTLSGGIGELNQCKILGLGMVDFYAEGFLLVPDFLPFLFDFAVIVFQL